MQNRVKLMNGSWLKPTSVLSHGNPAEAGHETASGVQTAIVYSGVFLAGEGNAKAMEDVFLADFLNGPLIREIDLSQFTGRMNGRIQLHFPEPMIARKVTVQIHLPDGRMAEQGEAVQQLFPSEWAFTLTKDLTGPWVKMKFEVNGV